MLHPVACRVIGALCSPRSDPQPFQGAYQNTVFFYQDSYAFIKRASGLKCLTHEAIDILGYGKCQYLRLRTRRADWIKHTNPIKRQQATSLLIY
jgi:hypothetical protein